MKATLKFDLPDENEEFQRATRGIMYYCALWDIKQLMYKMREYPEDRSHEQWCQSVLDEMPPDIFE